MEPTQENKIPIAFRIGEMLIVSVALIYLMTYPRNTVSDFIVLSFLCLVLILIAPKIGLSKPMLAKYSKADTFLIIFSIVLFSFAWLAGLYKGMLNLDSALKAIAISCIYFYYAWIQHFLAQRYLASRLFNFISKQPKDSKLAKHSTINAALATGFIFGVLHIPYPRLILPAIFFGFIYAYYFLTTGRLWAVVCSHAIISSAAIFWLLDDNPFREFVWLF